MMRLNKFIKSLEWWKLVPSGLNGMKDVIIDPLNIDTTASYVSAAAARDGSLLVAYIPPAHDGGVTVNLTVLKKAAFAYWFDPTDGSFLPVGESRVTNKGNRTFVPPGKNHQGQTDWVLIFATEKIAEGQ